MAQKKAEVGFFIPELHRGEVTVRIIGHTPLYYNAMSNKVKAMLLSGGGKKTAAEKREIKHNPEEEFRSSVYTQPEGDTLLCFPVTAFKNAMATAALETPGISKSSVNRLVYVMGEKAPIYGIPQLKMDVVRSADMNKTPDIRTRAFLPRWATEITVSYISQSVTGHSIVSMLANAGVICGIGDFRQEKGKGNYGLFRVDDDMDGSDEWNEIKKLDRDQQVYAMENPILADDETIQLMEYLQGERNKRL